MLYNVLVYPLLLYGITSCCLTFTSNFDSLLAIQSKFLKIINFSNQYDSPHPLYSTSKVLKVNDLINYNWHHLFMRITCNRTRQEFHSYFTDVAKVHSYSTHQASDKDLFIPCKNTTQYGLYLVPYAGASLWNSIPIDIRNKPFVYSFHKSLKQHYINLYQ